MRQIAAKRDANEPDIVQALRDHGASVTLLSVGGVPDLLVGYKGINLLLEVKSDTGELTKDQKVWHDSWKGQRNIVRTPEAAVSHLYFIDNLFDLKD